MAKAAQLAVRHRGAGAARHRRAAVFRLAAGACALSVAVGGCVNMPSGGSVQQGRPVQDGAGQAEDIPQMIPVPPGPGWTDAQIVDGFLAASASFADNHAVAREYLTPSEARKWRPSWAATVIGSAPDVKAENPRPNVLAAGKAASVYITGQSLATLTGSGQYLPARGTQRNLPGPGAKSSPAHFTLQQVAGQWRINQLPSARSLILTQAAFQRDYVPRNLYYYGPSGVLVPDPVFVPQQDTAEGPATGLVNALRQGPAGWLAGPNTTTSFPPGTRVIGVSIAATSAIVDLGGSAAGASRQVLDKMAAQIVWTLTSSSYSPSPITSVQLRIGQKPVTPLLLQRNFSGSRWLPARPGSRAYYIDGSGSVSVLSDGAQPARLSWPAKAAVTMIAVAPGDGEVAGIVPQPDGCTVDSGLPLRGTEVVSRRLRGGTCRSLSFDAQGDVWAAVGTHVWFLPEDGGQPLPVIVQGAPASDTITALRVAPDGVRVAMIAQSSLGSAKVLLGVLTSSPVASLGADPEAELSVGQQQYGLQAIGTGIADPVSLSWYDADHVLVLSGSRNGQLYEVPLNGGAVTQIVTPAGAVSVSSAGSETGSGGRVYIGTAGRKIMTSPGLNSLWRRAADGTAPVYPG